MKSPLRLALLAVVLTAPLSLSAKIVRTIEKTFAVQPGGNLKAFTESGDIRVETSDSPEVRVQVRQDIRATTEKEADEILAKLSLKLEQAGNEVLAEAKYEKRGSGAWFGSWPPVNVSFVVTVPRNFSLNLGTSGGDIAVGDLQGNVQARTSGGDLQFARIDGEIDAATSGGDIVLKEGTARTKLHTSGGDIVVDRAGGPTEVSTFGGDLELKSVAQLLKASTSGGDVHAVLTAPLKQDAVLSTSGGDMRVEIAKGVGFQLDASTSGGEVEAAGLTLEKGGSGKSRLAGRVNGGGPNLKLRASGGDIVIRTF